MGYVDATTFSSLEKYTSHLFTSFTVCKPKFEKDHRCLSGINLKLFLQDHLLCMR